MQKPSKMQIKASRGPKVSSTFFIGEKRPGKPQLFHEMVVTMKINFSLTKVKHKHMYGERERERESSTNEGLDMSNHFKGSGL